MEQYLFVSFIFAGMILVIIGLFFEKESWYQLGFTLWVVGLIGNIVVFLSRAEIEIQEPCQCEVCCKHKN